MKGTHWNGRKHLLVFVFGTFPPCTEFTCPQTFPIPKRCTSRTTKNSGKRMRARTNINHPRLLKLTDKFPSINRQNRRNGQNWALAVVLPCCFYFKSLHFFESLKSKTSIGQNRKKGWQTKKAMSAADQQPDIGQLAANLTTQLNELQGELELLRSSVSENNDAFFNCAMALIIFLMQCGFAFLEAGAVRSKNCTNIIIKNVLDSLLGILGYWAIGWALAFGPNPYGGLEPFFGFSQFFIVGLKNYAKFFFQFVFAATASTIISGAVAERAEFACFLTYSLLITSFCYPVLTHWGWTPTGWMAHGFAPDESSQFRTAYLDFAGSGMVHLCGGTISLIAAILIGPRIGRFPERKVKGDGKVPKSVEIKGHSVPFASLGGFILMFGFLAFNGGSTGEISSPGVGQTVAKAMVNTILCGAFAALAYLFVHFIRKGKWTVLLTINACLTGPILFGMVSACAGCNLMPAWTCVITGSVAGMAYLAFAELCLAMRIDDPLDAFAVHFGGGLWGLVSACIVTEKGLLFALIGSSSEGAEIPKVDEALWQLGWQMLCALAIIAWSALTLTPAFLLLKAVGKMRVPREVEIRGLDIYKHGEAAYPLTAYGHGWDETAENTLTPSTRHALRSLGEQVDVAMEELTLANGNGNGNGAKQFSVRQNPQQYEHPEHWEHAREPNVFKRYHHQQQHKPNSVSP